MIDPSTFAVPFAVGLSLMVRGLVQAFREAPNEPASPEVTVHSAPAGPPITRWQGNDELVAWRVWRLATFMSQCDHRDRGVRLLSFSAPCIWEGPAVHAERPEVTLDPPSGIHAVKLAVARRLDWSDSEEIWVTGTVALSGRVIEHAGGYRAERAVLRELRLSTGAHLAVRSLDELKRLIDQLENRYQVSVDIGQAERERADWMLAQGFKPRFERIPWVSLTQYPWRVI